MLQIVSELDTKWSVNGDVEFPKRVDCEIPQRDSNKSDNIYERIDKSSVMVG